MDPKPLPGLYTVRTTQNDTTKDLTFSAAMRLIQDRFELSNGKIKFALIERQD